MNVKGAIIYLPVEFPERSVTFYKNLFSNTPDIFLEDGLIIIELPNLNLYLIEKNKFVAQYSLKTSRAVQLISTTILNKRKTRCKNLHFD